MASNQPHTKRDVGGQSAKDEKAKSKEGNKPAAKTPPPGKPSPKR